MLPIHYILALLVSVSAAPHAHNQRQNKIRRRSTPLLHDDVLAIYNAAYVPTTTETSDAEETAAIAGAGPYAAGQLHGGNPNAVKAVVDVTTAVTAATPTAAAASSNDWVIAAAPRNTSMYDNSYRSDSDTEDDANEEDEDDDDNSEDDDSAAITSGSASQVSKASLESTSTHSSHSIPGWAIALTTVLLSFSLIGACIFAYLRFWKIRKDGNEKPSTGSNSDDALANYKAFWELKRQSAGSFTSADATPAALASERNHIGLGLRPVSLTSEHGLPVYQEHSPATPGSAAATPIDESAPPRGFLYQ